MNRFLTIVNLYVPPPFSLTHLDDMIQATHGRIFILGDFNLWIDWERLLAHWLPLRAGCLLMVSEMSGVFIILI